MQAVAATRVGVLAAAWLLVLSIGLLLVSAKAHGRQLRIRRMADGHAMADFRSPNNAPAVQALWAKDRKALWFVVTAAFVALGLAFWKADASPLWQRLLFIVPYSVSAGLITMGLWWWTDLLAADKRIKVIEHVVSLMWFTGIGILIALVVKAW